MIPNSYLLVPPHSLGEPHGKSSFPVHTALRRHGVTDIGMSIHGELLAPIERIPKTCSSSACHSYSLSVRSEEHTSELQSLMRISYAVFCLKKKTHKTNN